MRLRKIECLLDLLLGMTVTRRHVDKIQQALAVVNTWRSGEPAFSLGIDRPEAKVAENREPLCVHPMEHGRLDVHVVMDFNV